MQYKLISGDSHVNEPPDLWAKRMPAKYRERAPRMERMEQGDAWIFEGALDPISFGLNTNGGDPPETRGQWIRWEKVRQGGAVPAERLKEIDVDRVDAEILFPTPRPSAAMFWHNEDREFHLAQIRAYNDWLSEYASHNPERLAGLALLPTSGAQDAIDEYKRALALPGIRGVTLGQWPEGGVELTKASDPFFAEAERIGLPLAIHVAMIGEAPGGRERNKYAFGGEFRVHDVPIRALQLINTGALDRFPDLKFAFVEVDCGWVPYVMEQLDDRFKRYPSAARPRIKMRPSEYFPRHFYWVYVTDAYAIRNRAMIGVENMLWSSDYPHSGTDWPHSWRTIEEHFVGVPEDEKHLILAGNAERLYKMGGKR